ncbi:MAG: DUF2786 domain-containing protein [Marivibrio sp.]|uniref:DUF2786 domain-containing protein n=1 Tax=Marivibrio sp. TaxID=2039719 RepID=UPI0032EBE8F6
MTELAEVKEKIKKLLRVTTASGFSMHEAATAAAAARRLMAEHGLSEDELVMTVASTARMTRRHDDVRDTLAFKVGQLTNTKAVKIMSWPECRFDYFGREPAPMVAAYLRDMCEAGIDSLLRQYRQTTEYKRKRTPKAKRRASLAFVEGCVANLITRLDREMGAGVDQAAIAAADAFMRKQLDNDLQPAGEPRRSTDDRSLARGYQAAASFDLKPGVGGAEAPRLIGKA